METESATPETDAKTTTLDTTTTKDELRAAADVESILNSVEDDSLIKSDNLGECESYFLSKLIASDVYADTVGDSIDEFDYGQENRGLPEPVPPAELMQRRKCLLFVLWKLTSFSEQETKPNEEDADFDPEAFMVDDVGDSYMSKYILLIFFTIIGGLVGRVYYVRRQHAKVGGFGGITQDRFLTVIFYKGLTFFFIIAEFQNRYTGATKFKSKRTGSASSMMFIVHILFYMLLVSNLYNFLVLILYLSREFVHNHKYITQKRPIYSLILKYARPTKSEGPLF